MGKLDPDETLVAFALATFQVGLLVILVVLGLHLGGSLGQALSELSTAIGIAAFVVLWLTTCFCTYKAVHEVGLRHDGVPVGRLLISATGWGTRNGVALLLELVIIWAAVVFTKSVIANELAQASSAVMFFGVVAIFGSIVAASVGAIAGLIAGGLSAVLWAIANVLVLTGHPSVPVSSREQ